MARIVSAIAGQIIHIGRAGEHLATTVSFDVSDWLAEASQVYPGEDGYFTLYVHQTGFGYYEQLISQPGDEAEGQVRWHITNSNTAIIGIGKCELVYRVISNNLKPVLVGTLEINSNGNSFYVPNIGTVLYYGETTDLANSNYIYQDEVSQKLFYISGNTFLEIHSSDESSIKHLYEDVIVKSVIYDIMVTKSIDPVGDVPSPIQSWLDKVHKMTAVVANAEESIYESERWARGKIHGIDVPEGEDGYHDNSKYYAGESDRWARGKIHNENGQVINVPYGEPGYHDNSKYYSEQAENSANLAKGWAVNNLTAGEPSSTNNALYYSFISESYAKGTQNGIPVNPDYNQPGYEDNALFYKNKAKEYRDYIANSNQTTATTIEPTGLNPTPNATVSITKGQDGLIFNFGVPRGVPGTGLVITGTVASDGDLPGNAAETFFPDVGTAYGVGSQEPYEIWICTYDDITATTKTWKNFGYSMAGISATRYDWS